MKDRTCSVEDCGRGHSAKGFCSMHYARWVRNGDPLYLGPVLRIDPQEAVTVMRAAGMNPLESFPGVVRPWLSRCVDCGRESSPRLHDIKNGRNGCKHCSRERRTLAQSTSGSHLWVGEKAAYQTVHNRLRKQRGNASDYSCVDCGESAQDWSYDGGSPKEQIGVRCGRSLRYSTDLMTYSPRCTKCHAVYDHWGQHLKTVG